VKKRDFITNKRKEKWFNTQHCLKVFWDDVKIINNDVKEYYKILDNNDHHSSLISNTLSKS
jgi:hypothetical protein